MTLTYDEKRKRIICRWNEQVDVVMNKRKGRINRSKAITVKVNDSGRLNTRDRKRHEEHPMYRHISEFNEELNRMDYFNPGAGTYRCTICGSTKNVSPHFDVKTQSVVWLCPLHKSESPQIDA